MHRYTCTHTLNQLKESIKGKIDQAICAPGEFYPLLWWLIKWHDVTCSPEAETVRLSSTTSPDPTLLSQSKRNIFPWRWNGAASSHLYIAPLWTFRSAVSRRSHFPSHVPWHAEAHEKKGHALRVFTTHVSGKIVTLRLWSFKDSEPPPLRYIGLCWGLLLWEKEGQTEGKQCGR